MSCRKVHVIRIVHTKFSSIKCQTIHLMIEKENEKLGKGGISRVRLFSLEKKRNNSDAKEARATKSARLTWALMELGKMEV